MQTGSTRAGVPHLRDVVRASHRPIVDLVMAPDSIGVPLVGPAGIPADVTGILRKAFLAMAHDKDYQSDAERVELPVGSPIDGARDRGDDRRAGGRGHARTWSPSSRGLRGTLAGRMFRKSGTGFPMDMRRINARRGACASNQQRHDEHRRQPDRRRHDREDQDQQAGRTEPEHLARAGSPYRAPARSRNAIGTASTTRS